MESVVVGPPHRAATRRHPSKVLEEDVHTIVRALEPTLRPLKGSTVLVTGGVGFVCSYFIETIACLNDHAWEQSCQVLCVDNLATGVRHRLAHLRDRTDIRFIHHDISLPLSLRERVAWIIHGAGIASPMTYRRYPLETIEVNVGGTRQVLELAKAHRVRSVLYLSSSEIYGDPPDEWIPTPEHYRGNVSCTGPRACYDESKRLAETLCGIAHQFFRVPVKVVRPFNLYGPGQRLDDGRIIPDLMSAAVHRKPLVLYSDGRATRAFCYIRDAIQAMWQAFLSDREGDIFNVGNDQEEIRIEDLAERVRQIAGPPWLTIEQHRSPDPHYVTDNPQRRCPDLTKLRSYFPWEPTVTLAEGLQRTVTSCRELAGRTRSG